MEKAPHVGLFVVKIFDDGQDETEVMQVQRAFLGLFSGMCVKHPQSLDWGLVRKKGRIPELRGF